jgi:hopanoid biosynthesis associated protein HpnK
VKQLTITADDFGASPRVNDAVVRGSRHGILTAASWMAGGVAADEALVLARDVPTLALGVHLTLVCGRAVLPPSRIPLLVDAGGAFPRSPVVQGLRLARSRVAREHMRLELRAQIERCLAGGHQPRHLDAHLDFQVHPAIFPVIASLAIDYRIGAVRVPRDPLLPALAFDRRHATRKIVEAAVFAILCRRAVAIARRHGLRVADRVYGHHQTGAIDARYMMHLIASLPPGAHELYCHPGGAGQDDAELAALLDPAVRAACVANRVVCRHYDTDVPQGART